MKNFPLLLPVLAAVALAGCASKPARKPKPPDGFAYGLQSATPADRPSSLQAQAAGSGVLGLFDFESIYQARQADRREDATGLGQHSLSQGFSTALPLPLGTPLQLGLSNTLEQRWSDAGLATAQQRAARARWSEGGVQLAVDARRSSEQRDYDCGLDASLSTAIPSAWRAATAHADNLRLGGQLCQRSLPGASAQQARILSAQTGWKDGFGSRQLRLSHAVVRDATLPGERPSATGNGNVELSAQQALQLGGWSLSQAVAVAPADPAATGDAAWAARSQLSRTVMKLPLTASWQRSEAALWSLGGAPVSGREASLGLDLSRPLQQWLSPSSGATLSYHRLDPAGKAATADDQVRLGVQLGW